MFPHADDTDQDKDAAPEIAIIKDILLSDLRRTHEARMERLEERVAALSGDVERKLSALAARIEAVAAESGQSQKQALAGIAEAISQIALGLKRGEGAADHVGS